MRKLFAAVTLALGLVPIASASLVSHDFHWTGSGGYTMSGYFVYDSASASDGFIRDGEVVSLYYEAFLNGVSFASSATAHTGIGFNFNFDAVAGQFVATGGIYQDGGQAWDGFTAGALAFYVSDTASTLELNSVNYGFSSGPTSLVAGPAVQVPLPDSTALVALGIATMLVTTRRRGLTRGAPARRA